MTNHTLARVAGHFLSVIPRAPFRMQHCADLTCAIDVEHESPCGRRFARLIPDRGGYASELDQHTDSLFDVLDVEPCRYSDGWRIETTVFTCDWPRGYILCSTQYPTDPSPFDLVGPNGELIYVQRTLHVPDVAEMALPTQTMLNLVRTRDSEWIDLRYVHDGGPWRQFHAIVKRFDHRTVVTMQSPEPYVDNALAAAKQIVSSVERFDSDN